MADEIQTHLTFPETFALYYNHYITQKLTQLNIFEKNSEKNICQTKYLIFYTSTITITAVRMSKNLLTKSNF